MTKEFDFKELQTKEITAMELKYLSNPHKSIAQKIDTPKETVDEWFKERGKLSGIYAEYRKFMNAERTKKFREGIIESDENILMSTTNVMRHFSQNVLRDTEVQKKLSMKDYKMAWEIQRIMQDKPTSYGKSEVTQVTQEEIIEALGLTDEDFEGEKYEKTKLRIAEYVRQRELGISEGGENNTKDKVEE
jgi:hypothetical protein